MVNRIHWIQCSKDTKINYLVNRTVPLNYDHKLNKLNYREQFILWVIGHVNNSLKEIIFLNIKCI